MSKVGCKTSSMKIVTNVTNVAQSNISSTTSLDSKGLSSNASSSISLPNTPNSERSPILKHSRTRSSTDPNTIPLDLITSFQAHPWFANAEKSFSNDLISVIHIRHYAIGDTIIREGTKAKAMFFIIKGVVEVTSEDDEVVYAELGKGCFFGEIGVLFQVARTTSIVAKTKCIIAQITASEFYELYKNHPVVAKAIHDEAITRFTKLKTQKEERGKKLEINLNENILSPLKSINTNDELLASASSGNIRKLSSINSHLDSYTSNDSMMNDDHSPITNFYNASTSNISNSMLINNDNDKIEIQLDYANSSDEEKSPKIVIEGNDNIPNMLDSSIKVIEQNVQNPNLGFIQRYSGRRRASVAVWADDQLSKLQQNIQLQLTNKEKAAASASPSSLSPTSPKSPKSAIATSSLTNSINQNYTEDDTTNDTSISSMDPSSIKESNKECTINNNKKNKPLSLEKNQNNSIKTVQSSTSPVENQKAKSPKKGQRSEESSDKTTPKSSSKTVNGKIQNKGSSEKPLKSSSKKSKTSSSSITSNTSIASSRLSYTKRMEEIMKQPKLGPLPFSLMKKCLSYLDYKNQFRIRRLSKIFNALVTNGKTDDFDKSSPWSNFKINESLSTHIDLSTFPKLVNDDVLDKIVSQCGNDTIKILELNRCWGISDKGCQAIGKIGSSIQTLNLLDCWDVTDNGLVSLSSTLTNLEAIDLSNCRKITNIGVIALLTNCPKLTKLSLSYCKNISSEVFTNTHIWRKIKQLNLQRCTGIFDAGFAMWKDQINNPSEDPNIPKTFQLQKLNLSDCSFLSDAAISNISQVCPNLEEISLSFCCALTDECINELITNCKMLKVLDLNYCGLAMTDNICISMSEKCQKLECIGCRGCVQITDEGIMNLLSNIPKKLKKINCSQCNNVSEKAKRLLQINGVELLNNQVLVNI